MAACRVEVVASTVEDVLAAAAGGADRVEFCTHLASGGLTPGRSLIEQAMAVANDHNRQRLDEMQDQMGNLLQAIHQAAEEAEKKQQASK